MEPCPPLREGVGEMAAAMHKRAAEGKMSISLLQPSEIPDGIAQKAGLGFGSGGRLAPSSRLSALALCDATDMLLAEAQKPLPPMDRSEEQEARARSVLGAMDLVLSELVRQVMVECTERGLLLQYVRELIFEHCAHLSCARIDHSKEEAEIAASLEKKRAELHQTKEELVEVRRHVKTLNYENTRLGRINMKMAMQKARDAVLARASALSSEEEVNRKMVIDCVTKAAQELQRAECTISLAKRSASSREAPLHGEDDDPNIREGALYVTYASAEVQTDKVDISAEVLTKVVDTKMEGKTAPRRIYYAKDVGTDVDDLQEKASSLDKPVEHSVELETQPLLEATPIEECSVPITIDGCAQTEVCVTKEEGVQCFPFAKPVRSQAVQVDQKREYVPPGVLSYSDLDSSQYAPRGSTSVDSEYKGDAPVISLQIAATTLSWSKGKVRPTSWLYSTLTSIYSGPYTEGGIAQAGACFFRNKFGLSRVSDSYIADFLVTLHSLKDSSRRAAVFIQFCGIAGNMGTPSRSEAYTPSGLAMYKKVLGAIRNSAWRSVAVSIVEGEARALGSTVWAILETVLGPCFTVPIMRGLKVGILRAALRCEASPVDTSANLFLPHCVPSPPPQIHAIMDASIVDSATDLDAKSLCIDAVLDVLGSNTESTLIPLSVYAARTDPTVQPLPNVLRD